MIIQGRTEKYCSPDISDSVLGKPARSAKFQLLVVRETSA